jgi:hypothetical protein
MESTVRINLLNTGIYSKDGNPQCRHYEHDYNMPDLDPLDGATEHGLTYAHNFALTNHYIDINLPHHYQEGDAKSMKVVSSELWVNAFSEKPMAMKYEATYTKNTGETATVNAVSFHG